MRGFIFVVLLAGFGCVSRAQASVTMTMLPEPLLLYDPTNGSTTYTPIDLNADGEIDYTFGHGFSIGIRTERSNRVAIHLDPPPNLGGGVEALFDGYSIGSSLSPGDSWASSDLLGGYVTPGESAFTGIVLCVDTGCESRMPAVLSRVQFGLEFQIAGQTHYGYFDVEALISWGTGVSPARHRQDACAPYSHFMGNRHPACLHSRDGCAP